jgi:hypothetical protein
MTQTDQVQPLADAFIAGRAAFKSGLHESVNPHSDAATAPSKFSSLQCQWSRGYRNTRKSARFDATIAATNPPLVRRCGGPHHAHTPRGRVAR